MNNVKTVLLMTMLGVILVGVGAALGGQRGAVFALILSAGINFLMYFWSDKLAMKAAKARPVAEHELPQVYSMVRSLVQRHQMPMPAIYIVDSPQPNAFATGRNPKHAAVAVTRGIIALMNPQELESVLAHELAHVRNRDILISTVAATIAVALMFVTRMAMWRVFLGGSRRNGNNPLALVITIASIVLAPLAAVVIRSAIGRSREYEADRMGAQISGSPLALASALRKLEVSSTGVPMDVSPAVAPLFISDPLKALGRRGQSRGGSMFGRLFSTHPPISERVERLESMAIGFR